MGDPRLDHHGLLAAGARSMILREPYSAGLRAPSKPDARFAKAV
ncbi:MAG TPA: hypothetical protein VN137_02920 [Sphingomonas sp.]|nr:hypothetical protein [Sphingomonas sp.]